MPRREDGRVRVSANLGKDFIAVDAERLVLELEVLMRRLYATAGGQGKEERTVRSPSGGGREFFELQSSRPSRSRTRLPQIV